MIKEKNKRLEAELEFFRRVEAMNWDELESFASPWKHLQVMVEVEKRARARSAPHVFAKEIRRKRLERGLTAREMARRLGVNQVTLTHIEGAQTARIPLSLLFEIPRVLGVGIDALTKRSYRGKV